MTSRQKIELRQSEVRSAIAEELGKDEKDHSRLEELTNEAKALEVEFRAALAIEEATTPEDKVETPEGAELAELRSAVDFSRYVKAAIGGSGVRDGAEAEYNQHLGIDDTYFPLELLAEERATVDTESGVNQQSWIDRVFAGTAASALGVTMRSVSPGVASVPVTSMGGTSAQRGRQEDTVESTYTYTVTEMKPKRNSIHSVYSIEDNARLPGLSESIRRDMSMAMTEKIDRTIFLGDSGANENSANITGLTTATISEVTVTQANKVLPAGMLGAFLGMVDGIYAASTADLNVVATVGASNLWNGTIANSAAENQTLGAFLRANGVSWTTRGKIEDATANGDFGAFVGLARGQAGTAVAAVWSAAQMIVDPYSKAKSGEVELTMHYLWDFQLPRPANYRRIKFVT